MTTETRRGTTGTAGLVYGAAAGGCAGLVLALCGLVLGGSAAAVGALVGAALVVGILAFGAFSVNMIAGVMPAMSFVVALITYAAQSATGLVVLVALHRSGLLDDGTLSRGWLAAAVVASALAWSAGQIVALKRVRMPIYTLPGAGAR
ncbi:hypothetical protein [Nocardioides sambongensis]|uniref:hypothetical protein n=1 Tax=Nocardioides sambongensis TaxID=2589074 RepID=UPI00112A0CEC|nr:hypothetical protein [Nocardioides sambongensis]